MKSFGYRSDSLVAEKLPRCPRGTRRNKQTKACESVGTVTGTVTGAKTAKKRCPNGMRRNRVTQNCEPKTGAAAAVAQLRQNALQRLERAKPKEQKQYRPRLILVKMNNG